MKESTQHHLKLLSDNYPNLASVEKNIISAFKIMTKAFESSRKLLICGNGGSAADADHIVGELMKGFQQKRPIGADITEKLKSCDNSGLASCLQKALPAINLSAHTALTTAICNDTSQDMIFAQQVLGYGIEGDVLLGISTSGNSLNVINAGKVAKALKISTIGLTGSDGGKMKELFDIVIQVPSNTTASIQELHLPIYHTLCAMLEEEFFG